MTSATTNTFSLGLDDVEDGFEQPRRLLKLPCKSVLAYGGDDGIVSSCLVGAKKFDVVQRYDDGVRAVAFSDDGKRVAVGFDSGEIQVVKYDDYEYEEGIAHPFAQRNRQADEKELLSQDPNSSNQDSFPGPQFDAPIRDLLFLRKSACSFWLVIASESGMCLVDAESSETLSNRILERESVEAHGHCGIRGVSLDDASSQMASLAMDGKLCVWGIKMVDGSNTPKFTLLKKECNKCVAKKDVGEIHGSDVFDRSCRPVYHKSFLATPGQLLPVIRGIQGDAIKTILITNCEDDGHVESVVAIAFVSNNFLVTSGRDCRVLLWKFDCETGVLTPLQSFKLKSAATDLCPLEGGNVYAACANGSCAVIPLTKVNHERAKGEVNGSPKNLVTKTLKQNATEYVEVDSSPSTPGNTAATAFLNDEADEDDSVEAVPTETAPTIGVTGIDRFRNAIDQIEENVAYDEDGDLPTLYRPRVDSVSQNVLPQPPFSVSSSPLDLARRYLCWNHIASTTIHHGDGATNSRNTISINFSDSAYKRPITFVDNMNIILGAVGEDGAIFASDVQHDDEDDDSVEEDLDAVEISEATKEAVKKSKRRSNHKGGSLGSSVFFYRFETFGSLRDKDWFLQLPTGERVLGSACGQGWAAVMTSRRFLRLFSSGGNQREVVWLDGEPVTMVGRSQFLAVFYHKSYPLADKTQQLGYTLWDTASFTVVSKGSVSCLSAGATLTWAGFSNDCSLVAADSDGMFSMLVPCAQSGAAWEWAPILDTVGLRKSADDLFWPVSVYDGKIIVVPLKGGNTYPDASRRPVTTTLSLRMPLANSSNTVMEELSIRSNLALAQKSVMSDCEDANTEQEYVGLCAQVDKVTLKLFVATLGAGKQERAFDLVDRLHLEKSYDLAIRLAGQNRKVVDLIESAKARRFRREEKCDADEYYFEENSPRTAESFGKLKQSCQISPDANMTAKRTLIHGGERSWKRNRIY
eukprot:scaffold3036_cov117-Cylindrotheca_fusiformis.AAC.13